MQKQYSRSALSILVIGCMLSLISAFVPFFQPGYYLQISVLLAGISPYLVYGFAIPYLRTKVLLAPGLLLLIIHAWLVLTYRFTVPVDYSDHWIYYGPLLLAAAILPLAIYALRLPYTGDVEPKTGIQVPEA
ncbi:MAG: hypothetical protein RQ982_13450 [Gammaproteobacteria bacterium]|nr:hypothetical protein [Gammaproteobacteria bacterium]